MLKRMVAIAAAVVMVSAPAYSDAIENKPSMAEFLADYGNNVLPPPWEGANEETPEARQQRINMIAEVTDAQAQSSADEGGWWWSVDDLKMAAFIKMWYESGRFRLAVHQGKIRGDHGRSVCLGQIMNGGKKLVGTDRDSTQRCVAAVMKHLIKHQRRCLNDHVVPSPWAMSKIYAGYGTGWSCSESTWMPVKLTDGSNKLDSSGQPIKDHWARTRGYSWWKLRNAFAAAQKD